MINIDNLIQSAIKKKHKIGIKAYRNIKVEIQKYITSKGAKPLTDELQLQLISKYAKSLEEAITQFTEANRDDLVAEYISELEVVKTLLPAPVSESKIRSELINWAKVYGFEFMLAADSPIQIPRKEIGTIIKYLKSKFPTADGKIISNIVKEYIV